MDSGSKFLIGLLSFLTFGFFLLTLTEDFTANSETEALLPKEEWKLAGTIGGKHFLTMSLKCEGNDLTGNAINTQEESRSIHGEFVGSGFFLLQELNDEERKTGTFEGRRLENGDLRGIWSTPDGKKWFPFYLRPEAGTGSITESELAGGHPE